MRNRRATKCDFDTCSETALANLSDRKDASVPAAPLDDPVVPFFEQQDVPLLRMLTDGGTKHCGAREHHEYQLYPAIEVTDYSRTETRSSPSNAICERFRKTLVHEFCPVGFRKKIY